MSDTKMIHFYGSSDDNFVYEVYQNGKRVKADEIGCYEKQAVFQVGNKPEGMKVIGQYIKPGVWMVGIAPLDDEDSRIPSEWINRIYQDGYTSRLILDEVPAHVQVGTETEMDPDYQEYQRLKAKFSEVE